MIAMNRKKGIILIISIISLIAMGFIAYTLYAITYTTKESLSIQTNQTPVMKKTVTATLNEIQKEPIVLSVNNEEGLKQTIATAKVKPKTYEGYEMIATLKVPSIGIEYPVLAENSDELMKITLNKYWGCEPNEVGNFCIVGHNYKSGKHFGKLKYVNKGDKVLLTDNAERTLTYEVYEIYVIDPYDTKCTSQLTDGRKEVTLITCTNAGKNRLVVKAKEI